MNQIYYDNMSPMCIYDNLRDGILEDIRARTEQMHLNPASSWDTFWQNMTQIHRDQGWPLGVSLALVIDTDYEDFLAGSLCDHRPPLMSADTWLTGLRGLCTNKVVLSYLCKLS